MIALDGPWLPLTAADELRQHQVSSNVAGLCIWVNAMCTYTEIAKVVKPKIAELKIALGKLKVRQPEPTDGI